MRSGPALFVLARALTYASIFVGLVLVFLPARLLEWSGVSRPESIGVGQVMGIAVGSAGALLALLCVLTFAHVGRGTPAPFDAPRRLVVRGPYRYVRNPMYVGAGLALVGASLFYQSVAMWGFTAVFLLAAHVFVVTYEEPTLRRTFGREYEEYRERVRRWLPTRTANG